MRHSIGCPGFVWRQSQAQELHFIDPMGPLVSLASLLALVFLAPAVHADTLLYADHLAVYDGTGRQVGSSWPTSTGEDFTFVEFRLGSTPVIVHLRRDGFVSTWLRFSNPGCTGQARVDAFEGELYRYTAVVGPRKTVWVQSGTVRARTARSTLAPDGVCHDHDPIRDLSAPVKATAVDLADYFVPPFTTRTRARTPVPGVAP